jgi:hypothetical protein
MSRSTTLSVSLPGAYPNERNRYNSSSSGLSSAASYQTAFETDQWDEDQSELQQSLVEATKASEALEKFQWSDQSKSKNEEDKKAVKPPNRSDVEYFRIAHAR